MEGAPPNPQSPASPTSAAPKKASKSNRRLSQMFEEETQEARTRRLSQMGTAMKSEIEGNNGNNQGPPPQAAAGFQRQVSPFEKQVSDRWNAVLPDVVRQISPASFHAACGKVSDKVKRRLSARAEVARNAVSARFHDGEKASKARYWRLVVGTALGSATLSFVIDEYTFQFGNLRETFTNLASSNNLLFITLVNVVAVCFARVLVRQCIEAEGSGFPDMKAMIFGKVMPNYLTAKVLVIKAIALGLVVGAGLPAGKEGPNVHMAACITRVMAPQFFTDNLSAGTSRGRAAVNSILLAACAVGVAASFSSPIGGVIFTVEFMLPQLFDRTTYWGCLVATVSGSLWYAFLRSETAGAGTLEELISTNVVAGEGATAAFPICRALLDVALGAVCGLCAGMWIIMHTKTNKWLKTWRTKAPSPPPAAVPLLDSGSNGNAKPPKPSFFANFQWRDLFIVGAITALNTVWAASLPMLSGKPQPRIISDMFDKTLMGPQNSGYWTLFGVDLDPRVMMIICLVMKWVTTILTLAMAMPTGVVAPTMIIGALIGRVFVMTLVPESIANLILGSSPGDPDHDEIYNSFMARFALVGAAAFCAGVCRCFAMAITIFECTALPSSVLPLSMATLTSIFVANKVALPFFDCNLVGRGLGGIPFLSSTDHALRPVYDIMKRIDPARECCPRNVTPQDIRKLLSFSSKKHFAIVEYLPNSCDALLEGSVTREHMEIFACLKPTAPWGIEIEDNIDLLAPQYQRGVDGNEPLVDGCPMHCDQSLTVKDAYITLKITNPKEHVYVTREGRLLGSIDFADLLVQKV